MPVFHRVLFPVDMSEACTATAPFVEALVRRFAADLTLLHVMDLSPLISGWDNYASAIDTEPFRRTWRDTFSQFLVDRFEGITVRRVLREGDPAQEVIAYAESSNADLIMMPTHGYGLFRSLLLGSVTAKVLHAASCPVWTGAHIEETPAHLAEVKNVLCALDFNDQAIALMQSAAKVAQTFSAKLWLLHVLPSEGSGKRTAEDIAAETKAREKMAWMQLDARVAAHVCLGAGDVPQVIRDAALHHEAGVVVAGRGHATETFGRLRTQVYSIIRQSPCPVISL